MSESYEDEGFQDQIDRMEAMLEHNMVQIAYNNAMLDEIMHKLEIEHKIIKKTMN
jgi:hypothetical protein